MTNNLDYVKDVKNRYKYEELKVLTNGGSIIFYRKGQLIFLLLDVHVNDNSLVTILSLKYVNNIPGVGVTMYSSIKKAMNVILRDGTVLKFK